MKIRRFKEKCMTIKIRHFLEEILKNENNGSEFVAEMNNFCKTIIYFNKTYSRLYNN